MRFLEYRTQFWLFKNEAMFFVKLTTGRICRRTLCQVEELLHLLDSEFVASGSLGASQDAFS